MIAGQIWVMGVALVCGLLIAFFYDIYWLLLASRRLPRGLRALQDMLFWLAAFCLVAAIWLYCTGGIMRLSVYLWLGIGVSLFRLLLSPRLRRKKIPLPRKLPRMHYTADLPAAVMFAVGCFICRIKPRLLKKAPQIFKSFFDSFFSKKE